MAAHRLGITEVTVVIAAGWSEAKKRAYLLADNQLTLNGEWDLERLAIEIAELRASDFDISLIGFSESEVDDLLKADEDVFCSHLQNRHGSGNRQNGSLIS